MAGPKLDEDRWKYTGYHTGVSPEVPSPRPPDDAPDSPARKAARARLEAMRTFGTLGTLGLSVVIALVIGVALGLWLDRLTGWSPTFFIVGFLVGLAAGVLNIYRTMSRFSK